MYTIPVLIVIVFLIFGGLMFWSQWSTEKLMHPQKKMNKKADLALEQKFLKQLISKK